MTTTRKQRPVGIITILGSDSAFSQTVDHLAHGEDAPTPAALQARLRRVFPLAVVRARELSGEAPAWYVYRDGGWRSSLVGQWWELPGLPQVAVTADGFLTEANATALDLLGIDADDLGMRHFTDFVTPGTLQDALALFDIIQSGKELTATILVRPSSGHVIGVDFHAWRDSGRVVGVLRLAGDIESPARPSEIDRPR